MKSKYVIIKNANTKTQRFLKVVLASGTVRASEVVNLNEATLFDSQGKANQWLELASKSNKQLFGFQVMVFQQ